MKDIKKFVIFALTIASLVFFAHSVKASCPGEIGSGDPVPSIWTKECSPYVIKTYIVANDPVTIEPGVIVKFKYAAFATFNNSVTAIGTEKDEVVFTAYTDDEHGGDTNGDLNSTKPKAGYWNVIHISDYATAHFENVLFLYGGEHPAGTLSIQPRLKDSVTVKSCEFKHNKYAGININYNPNQIIQNNLFSDNAEGIVLNDCDHNTSATISGNSFDKNINYGAKVTYPNYNTLDARNSWWGDKSGPFHPNLNPTGQGDRVSDGVLFDPWIGKGSNDPVIIIPGIMGSWEKDGKWQIDPIFHTYDNLYEEFINEGYIPEKDLFAFPYQWRDSNKVNAVELKAKIQEIKNQTNFPKVDIVAHSMGGLLAREYIESDYYNDDVNKLITIGTPHLGAPKDYITWEGGEFAGPSGFLLKAVFKNEAEKNSYFGYSNIFNYIHGRPVESVKELLPVYNYLYDVESNYSLRETYPSNYPRNEFLENLNNQEKLNSLNKLEFIKIFGNLQGAQSTISGLNVVSSDDPEMWQHGYPENFWFKPGSRGLVKGLGDGTVPLFSAESLEIPSARTITLQSEHNALPTDAQKDILEILTGVRPENEVREWRIDDILISLVYSPVDIQIVSPSDQKIGKNFETGGEYDEIAGAFYTGYDTRTEFITIPNPEDGEYKILTQGTGEGEYKIETTKITEDENDPLGAKESTATIEGTAQEGETSEARIEVTENEAILVQDTTPPEIIITSPEEKNYLNDQVLPISYVITDNISPQEKIIVTTIYDSKDFSGNDIDLSLEHLGSHTFAITATDEAGNTAEKEVKFKITTNLEAVQSNIDHYWDLDLIKKKYEKTYLKFKLEQLEELFKWLNQFENSNLNPVIKKLITDRIKKIINSYISQLIFHISYVSPQLIDEKAAEFLIEDLNYIRP